MDNVTKQRILDHLSASIEVCEKDSDDTLGVYVEIDGNLYSWNGESLVIAGKADDLLNR